MGVCALDVRLVVAAESHEKYNGSSNQQNPEAEVVVHRIATHNRTNLSKIILLF
jgi:hypothetical protein